jgi:response regulator RpfG family c-di-GMP phosphodiesterase
VGLFNLEVQSIMTIKLPFRGIFNEFFQNKHKIIASFPYQKRQKSGGRIAAKNQPTSIMLLVGDSQTRDHLFKLLVENNYFPELIKDPENLLQLLKEKQTAIVLIDCQAVSAYGTRILTKIKVACRLCRLIMFCDKSHLADKEHRELLKEVLNIGVYACILAPYKEWEVLSMFSYFP